MVSSIGNVYAGADSPPARRSINWATIFWTVWTLTLGVRVVLAMTLSPFGDEAWYWQESRALDWSYSDIPLATAALIRFSETLFGHSLLGMRAVFLLLGAAVPIILMRMSRRLFGPMAGSFTGLLASSLPLIGTLGLFALPDVPLTFASAVALDRFEVATRTNRIGAWMAFSLALAVAWLSHYRAAMLVFTGLCFLIVTPRGRALLKEPRLWIALVVSCVGLIPLAIFNLQHDWVAVHFQVVERNPWTFHSDARVQPIEQAMICTPLFYLLMLWTVWQCLRRAHRGGPWDILAITSVVPILTFFVVGFFADDTRFRLHWSLPGYLPIMVAMPALVREQWQRRRARWAFVVSFAVLAAGMIGTYVYLAIAASPDLPRRLADSKTFPEHFVGWKEAAAETAHLLEQPAHANDVLVADNFMLASELDFAFGGTRPVYTLDHPINLKHGRSPQLALWQRDEAGLRTLGAVDVLLISEPTARRERERAEWMRSLCNRVSEIRPVSSLDLFGGRKRYRWFSAKEESGEVIEAGDCAAIVTQ